MELEAKLAERENQLREAEASLRAFLKRKRKLTTATLRHLRKILATVHVKTNTELMMERMRDVYGPAIREMVNRSSSLFNRLKPKFAKKGMVVSVRPPARYR